MSASFSHFIGAACALGSAAMWAISAILFRKLGNTLPALALNMGKGVVALVCLGALLLTQAWIDLEARALAALAVSGVLGIALGDTLYFLALTRLGARVTLVLSTLIPIATALVAWLAFNENLSGAAWLAVALTVTGVGLVLWEHTPPAGGDAQWRSGVTFGLLFVAASVAAILFTKIGVDQLPAMQATFVRQLWAVVALAAWGFALRVWPVWVVPLRDPRLLAVLTLAAFIGAFLGTWLSVAALKYTHAAVATALNSTSPLFVLPLAAWWLKERVSVRAIVGAAVAVTGVAVYFISVV